MLYFVVWLGHIAAVAARFDLAHTQYGTSPPVYPAPYTTGAGGWEEALEAAKDFVGQLTLAEKAGMVTGREHSVAG
ncbi:glycoside hydrolase family 3 protein [Plenodomus tracheiphilus IPT5]|uniref:Glycoside hydrolase family 3 protein n=1 Tax=Plenodomus tracheiphilus IPT5 TaxID=1408161 RepID=A0A6A7AND9_9PLEO|nr:glycoside hydrolase family 3 protein [Plenodomus tracheiphilus IPT5]